MITRQTRVTIPNAWGYAVMLIGCQSRLENLGVSSEYLLELVQSLLQLAAVASTKTRLLALLVLAQGSIAATPAAGGLSSVTFHLLSRGKSATNSKLRAK